MMFRKLISLALAFWMISCSKSAAPPAPMAPAVSPPKVIIAGRGIGEARVGMTLEQMAKSLGEPQSAKTDASNHLAERFFPASGVRGWFIKGKAYKLSIDSGSAKTREGLALGSGRAEVESRFVAKTLSDEEVMAGIGTKGGPWFHAYDAGVSFEFKDEVVTSIAVYKGQVATKVGSGINTPDEGATLFEMIDMLGLPMSADSTKVIYRCLDARYNEEKGIVTEFVPTTDSLEWCQ